MARIGDGGDGRAESDVRWKRIAFTRAMMSMITG
jgi:hypothetical protein